MRRRTSPDVNAGHATAAALSAVPDRTALVVDGDALTFAGLETLTRRTAAALAATGVGPGDRVALLDRGSALAVATIFAAARLGAATAQMNAHLTEGELRQLAGLAGARVGVAGGDVVDRLGAALDGPVLGAAAVAAVDGDAAPPTVGDGDDTALVLFTSGTTGLPKPVAISHRSLDDRMAFYGRPIDPAAAPAVDLLSVPLFHIGGTLGMLVSLHQGKQLVILPRFEAGAWLDLVERHRVTQTFVVPTMLRRILDHPRFAAADLGSLRSLSYGAAAAPVDLVRRAVAALPGVDLSNTFGQTETLGAFAALTPEDHRRGDRLGSLGRPLPGIELRILDPVTGEPVPPGAPGEFVVRAGQNTTAAWLRTGDTGWEDAEGYLFLTGRLADTINRGGEKFGPVEVEEVLRTHPAVVDVGVVGVPDPDLGERVGAVVVTDGTVSAAGLIGHASAYLAGYKVPELVVFVDELPVTALGKPDRPALRARLAGATPAPRPAG